MTDYTTSLDCDNLEGGFPDGGGTREGGGPPSGERAVLITAHNSTISSAVFWVGGSKVRVNRNYPEQEQKGGGIRGKVTGFSKGSRRRFMRKLAEVERNTKPLFVTLTFPDEYYPCIEKPAHWKRLLKRFVSRIARKFPGAGGFWRLELQTRKSGQCVGSVFPHFHLLLWGVSKSDFEKWAFVAWWDACGRLSPDHLIRGVDVQELDGQKHVFAYISKYMAKVGDYALEVGRVWGVIQITNIPWVRAILCEITEGEAVQLIRYMRRFARLRGRDYKSLTVLLNAEFWWLSLDKLLYPS